MNEEIRALHQKMKSMGDVKAFHILVLLLRLRQICCHPGLIEGVSNFVCVCVCVHEHIHTCTSTCWYIVVSGVMELCVELLSCCTWTLPQEVAEG
jgi:SNF2 family DNA or RNA helicase